MAAKDVANARLAYGAPDPVGAEKYLVSYDFAEDGGAITDTYQLVQFKEGVVAARLVACRVKTAGASGGAATITLGVDAGTEFLNAEAIASFADGAVLMQDVPGEYYKVAADSRLVMSIGTAALTAGKFEFLFEVIAA